ncbi:MAG TPA: carboxypeptidase-like regulatory domain-containing protein [Kofleriaceae bacterium]|nr:carboxypeptidase-like regulatory domain-containing protein [Kofleriaceae bacterium]
MSCSHVRAALALLVLGAAAPAAAGTLSGTITQAGAGPVASAEVRVWQSGIKGWSILMTTTANASGAYAFTLPAGTYRVDARGPAGGTGNLGDRWYDVAAPNAGGYVGDDADDVTVGAGATSGIDLALEVLGGADGQLLRAGNVGMPSAFVRMERRADPRIHHNDTTDITPAGQVSMRGMVPAGDYQIIAYDPSGVRDTLLAAGPYTITSNVNGSLGNLTMADAGPDPYEGNNAPNCAVGFDPSPLHQDPPQPWQSTNARIGPMASNDVDWYCFTAAAGDRLFVSASTAFTFGGATRYHPWTDPMVSFWRGAKQVELAEDDDSGPGPLDARVDTGPLAAGCYCIGVTTFGDGGYVGAGQQSTGRYTLDVRQGNRPPVVSIRKGVTEVPASPAILYMDEGDTLALVLGYADADHDAPTKSFTHTDAMNHAVAGGMLVLGAAGGTYTWTAPPGSQVGSPYTLTLTAADAEFTMHKDVTVVVNGVNGPPTTPVPTAPVGGDAVMTGAPALTWQNATDPESEPLAYDVELYYDDTDHPPDQLATVAEAAGGMTSWTPATIPENTHASWRVRARDGHPNGLSPWSPYATFLVDVANDPPDVPLLIKPADGEVVPVRRPGLSALDVTDPEDDDVSMVFEIAADRDFTSMAWTSDPVPMNAMAVTTMASTGVDLAWGQTYYARVRAQDDRGAMSDWSDVHPFELTENVPPTTPSFADACVAAIYQDAPPSTITVTNVVDHEGEPVTFEVEFFTADANPDTGIPVYRTTAPMDTTGTTTAIPIDLTALPNGMYQYRVRAHDGTSPSDWISCALELAIVKDDGGCCDSGAGPVGSAAPLLLGLVGFAVTRRRRARARA